ncbi:MAG: histidinol dehydrogenase [Solirubrobacterales bacterium]
MRARHFTLESIDPGEVRALAQRPADVASTVAEILADVRARGDEAVVELTRRFDSDAAPEQFRVPSERLEEALAAIAPEVRVGLDTAIANVRRVAEMEVSDDLAVQLPEGHTVTLRELPVARAGLYVPGGRAAYPSSVIMCCVPARVAGVEQIAVATPPGPGGDAPEAVLAACWLCGAEEVHLMGGAQAVAALAYGTASVAPVDVIVGPGSPYVQEAKRQLVGLVGIDSIAGPTELLVVADAEADPEMVALDLAAQAEHGPDTLVAVASPDPDLLEAVAAAVAQVAGGRPTVQDAPLALVRTRSIDAAIDFANAFAPEHLELACADAARLAGLVTASGCVFIGGGAAFGDYAAGSNHVLPTGGAARFSGPLGASAFRRRQALVSLPESAAHALAPHVSSVARAEGFPVHAESAEARAGSPGDSGDHA